MRELKNDEINIHVIKIPFTSNLFLLLCIFFLYRKKIYLNQLYFAGFAISRDRQTLEKNLNSTETHVFVSRTISKMLF